MIWELLGGLFLFIYGFELLKFLWKLIRLYVLPKFGLKIDLKKFGRWAVVTGSTSGIGRGIAIELARRGLNIVLISRSEEKLNIVAKELELHGVQVKTIQFDFNTTSGYEKIKEQLKEIDVGILVNNVGACYDYPEYFMDLPFERCEMLVNINIKAQLKMTRMVLEKMVAKKTGLIVHVTSLSSFAPFPLLAVYSASKVFMKFFGLAMNSEYKKHAIIHQVLHPNAVSTNMTNNIKPRFGVVTAESYARSTVDGLGLNSSFAGCWHHELQPYFATFLPQFLSFGWMFLLLSGLRTVHLIVRNDLKNSNVR